MILDLMTRLRAAWNLTAARIHRSERAEGVISTAIAVLIMAFLGALMWIGFRTMWSTTESNANDQIDQIGS